MNRTRLLLASALLGTTGVVLAWPSSKETVRSAPIAENAAVSSASPDAPPVLAPALGSGRNAAGDGPSGAEAQVPAHPASLAEGPAAERAKALDALAAKGAGAAAHVQEAIAALHDPDDAVRAAAGRSLAAAGRSAVAPLISAVREDIARNGTVWSSFPSAAMIAFDGLAEHGADLLAQALGEASLDLWATSTMSRSGGLRKDLSAALPVIQALLRGENERARQWAAQAVVSTGVAAERAVPDLAQCLTSRNVQTRLEAVQALGRIGPVASSALSDLRTLAGDPNGTVRRLAIEAIARIEGR